MGIKPDFRVEMARVLEEYASARRGNRLLLLPFTTVNDYLWTLRGLAQLMRPLGGRALFYLAAAVSDFFIPAAKMVKHKIQSSEDFNPASGPGEQGGETAARIQDKQLIMNLDPVPKFLKTLVESWSPEGMIVSFKLETDPDLLVTKARYALEKYRHHLVVGNLLATRKYEVVFVSRSTGDGAEIKEQWIRVPKLRGSRKKSTPAGVGLVSSLAESKGQENGVVGGEILEGTSRTGEIVKTQVQPEETLGESEVEIESLMVPEIAKLHGEIIGRSRR